MGFNPADLFRVKSAASKFNANHPKLLPFFGAAKNKAMTPGSVIEIEKSSSFVILITYSYLSPLHGKCNPYRDYL